MRIAVCKVDRKTLPNLKTNHHMKPPPFSYHDPNTVAEVVGLLSTLENAKLLARGPSLIPMLDFRSVPPHHISDLNRVEGFSYNPETRDCWRAAATTRHRA